MRRNPLVPNADRPGSYLGSTPPHQLSGGQTWMQNATAANAALGQMQGTDFSTDEGFAQGHSIARTQKSASDALQGNVDRLRNASVDPSGANAYDMAVSGQMLPFEAMQGASPYWSKQISDWARENYRRPRPLGQSVGGGSPVRRAGAPPQALQDEAIGQLERIVGNMARGQGRTAQATRARIGEYKAALMAEVPGESPEDRARRINSAWSDLSGHLNSKGLLNRFEQRLFKEGGKAADGIGDMLRNRITSELERQIMSEQAGVAQQDGSGGLVVPQRVRDQASRPRSGAARSGTDAGVEERTPDGIRVSRFDSVDAAMSAIKGGTANVRAGEMAVIGGMPMVAISGLNQFGDPELQFVTAITMGGVPVPDPEGVDAIEWGDMLSPNARSAILNELSSNPQYRSAMSPEMIARVDQIKRSRVGLLAQRMNPRDRDAALADLKQQETEALHAAIVGGVGGMARTATSQSLHESRIGAKAAIDRAREAEENRYNESMKRLGERPPLHAELSSQVPGADAADMGGEPPKLRPDPGVASLWDLMGTEQRSSVTRMLAGVSMMAGGNGDQQADFAQRHLPLSALKRVLTLAGNGADEWTLAATIESAKPGYLKANYGDDPRYVGGVNAAFASWQRDYVADVEKAGENRAMLMPRFLEMHSWFVINDALGLLNDEDGQFWSGLRPELKSSAQSFANHMMNMRGGASSSLNPKPEAGEAVSPQAQAAMASFPSSPPPPAHVDVEVAGRTKALPIPTAYRDSRTGSTANPPLSPVAISPSNTRLFSGVGEIDEAKRQYDADGTGPIAVLMQRFPDMDADAIVRSQTMLAGASREDLARAIVPGSPGPRRSSGSGGPILDAVRRGGEDLTRRLRDPDGFRSESSSRSAVEAASRAEAIVAQVFEDMTPKRRGRGFKSTYALRKIGPDGSLQRFDGQGWKADPDLTRDFWVAMSVLGRISWKDFDRSAAAADAPQ